MIKAYFDEDYGEHVAVLVGPKGERLFAACRAASEAEARAALREIICAAGPARAANMRGCADAIDAAVAALKDGG